MISGAKLQKIAERHNQIYLMGRLQKTLCI